MEGSAKAPTAPDDQARLWFGTAKEGGGQGMVENVGEAQAGWAIVRNAGDKAQSDWQAGRYVVIASPSTAFPPTCERPANSPHLAFSQGPVGVDDPHLHRVNFGDAEEKLSLLEFAFWPTHEVSPTLLSHPASQPYFATHLNTSPRQEHDDHGLAKIERHMAVFDKRDWKVRVSTKQLQAFFPHRVVLFRLTVAPGEDMLSTLTVTAFSDPPHLCQKAVDAAAQKDRDYDPVKTPAIESKNAKDPEKFTIVNTFPHFLYIVPTDRGENVYDLKIMLKVIDGHIEGYDHHKYPLHVEAFLSGSNPKPIVKKDTGDATPKQDRKRKRDEFAGNPPPSNPADESRVGEWLANEYFAGIGLEAATPSPPEP